jgi:acetylornithine deacetylase/succinyl-diaminopimelate desuccinylase-like protein
MGTPAGRAYRSEMSDADPTGEVTDLLQHLIRNACVNDGTPGSGHEDRSADTLRAYLGGTGLDVESFTSLPGRESVVARIEGSDPDAPTVLLMGHTDVVPVNPDGWSRDPFGGELIDGFIWGRGAVDMLNLTASMAVAFKRLALSGFKPRGTLAYLAVADEESMGRYGAEWLVDNHRDDVIADYVLTESGGYQMDTPEGVRLPVLVEEKGVHWATLRIHGTPGHGSQPYNTDNALVTAAEVVRRIASYRPQTQIHDTWRRFVEGMHYPAEMSEPLLDAARFDDVIATLPAGMGRMLHSCTHNTLSPNVMHGGNKTNVIPDSVELEVDIRTLPGETIQSVRAMVDDVIGDLAARVDVEWICEDTSTRSPIDTPLWESMDKVSNELVKGSALVPFIMVAATDNRFFRRAGSVGYGYGLFSRRLSFEDYSTMFHGHDERVDQDSLRLSTELWETLARDFLG